MSNHLHRTATTLLVAIAVLLAAGILVPVAHAQDSRDDSGGGYDIGRGGPAPPGTPTPPGDGSADPDGHSINTEPWHFGDPAGSGGDSSFMLFLKWAREYLFIAILMGPLAGFWRFRS